MNDTSKHTLAKTCTNCGQIKPLSAFLQMSAQGTSYGSICADCRKAGVDKKETVQKDSDEGTAKTSGLKVSKLTADIANEEHFGKIEEEYHKEREVTAEQNTEQLEKREKIAKDERKHRLNFLEKSAFLNATKTEDKRTQVKEAAIETVAKETQATQQNQNVETAAKAKEQQESINLAAPVVQTTDQMKFRSVIFKQFKDRIGVSAAIMSQAEKASILREKSPQSPDPKANAASSTIFKEKPQQSDSQSASSTKQVKSPVDTIKENYPPPTSPSSRRR